MNQAKNGEQTGDNCARHLREIRSLWKKAEDVCDYARIHFLVNSLSDLAGKHPDAKEFARKKRDEIRQTIISKQFLIQLNSGLGEDHALPVSPTLLIGIFVELNLVVGEPSATMAYYEKACDVSGVSDVLDWLFWDYWFQTEQWDKILNCAAKRGWLSNQIAESDTDDFIRYAQDLFGAMLRSGNSTGSLNVLECLGLASI